ncbi:glycosyltransferase [Janibacter sp. Soil728]|uniref:glycosyltransferase n=1 Tax=Janibacter sp. Soil728 TaxID=1736393 RepID=UPI0012E8439C|nr:glycosyltransferase [Janibacter sp. Soil728]
MHPDELQDDEALTRQLLEEIVSDPAAVLEELQTLRRQAAKAKGLRSKLDAVEAKIKSAKSDLATADTKRQGALARADRSRAELASAEAALRAYRAETARLKEDLQRVRTSRSMRVGKALTSPGRVFRPGAKPAPTTKAAASPSSPAPIQAAAAAPAQVPAQLAKPKHARASAKAYEELLAELAERPTAGNLVNALNRAWFGLGSITEAHRIASEHPGLVTSLDAKQRIFMDRAVAAARVRAQGIPVPPRSAGAAYVPEPGRVLYCVHSTPAYNTNGYSTRTRGVAAGLGDAGVDVAVVARAGYPWDSQVDKKAPKAHRQVVTLDDVEYTHLPGPRLGSTPIDHYILACADAFVREARLRRPAVIQSASNHVTGLAALIAARRVGVPFVYEVRGLWEVTEASGKEGWDSTERYQQQVDFETLVASEADAVLAITEETRQELIRRGVPGDKITLAPNAVDPTVFVPLPKDEAYAKKHGVRTDVPVIGFAGSMVPYEGLDLLIEAVALLRDEGVDTQLVLAGSGAAEPALEKQAEGLGLGDTVRFVGRVPASEMQRMISLFDVMPCPRRSLPVTEMVSPLKPLEAFACAKAVVLSDVSPHRTLAGADGERAVLVPADDARALADALRPLLADEDLRADLGRRSRLWTIDERTWVRVAQSFRGAHARATEAVAAHDPSTDRELRSLRVGIIADEFTTETLRPTFDLVPLDRAGWRDQLDGLDLVFVESAWKGNDGQWHRGVGRYDDDEFADIVALLTRARELGIPSVFWNKEDPVHIERFISAASLCDHVFTTDANCVPRYLAAGVGTVRTASGLPFYAQPLIHNPLPGNRPYDPSVAYAGTYYGDRYAKRSAELSRVLTVAQPFGLSIYDRQAAIPDSPYHFPAIFRGNVRGSLPYDAVIDSYKSHLANLNVNSVADSPTMFSRRVVEVAACGGVVLSGPGRGIVESLGPTIPAVNDADVWRASLGLWSSDPQARLREAWRQMRTVLRSHTVTSAMLLLTRTAGIATRAQVLPTYAAVVDDFRTDVLDSLAHQSVLPTRVLVVGDATAARERLTRLGIDVLEWDGRNLYAAVTADYITRLDEPVAARTGMEDLLHARAFGNWERISGTVDPDHAAGDAFAHEMRTPMAAPALVHRSLIRTHHASQHPYESALESDDAKGIHLTLPEPHVRAGEKAEPATNATSPRRLRVVVAGHDLKFARAMIRDLRAHGHEVKVDEWRDHANHDEERSNQLLQGADIVVCEWGLGNAVWYSQHVMPGQRLVVRVHSQELRRPYLSTIKHSRVDAYVFVGELIRDAAVASHGVPEGKAHVVPNAVDLEGLDAPKLPGVETTLGLVGIVARSKRLDRALDVLEGLRGRGLDYSLRIKGRTPADYPWMAQRPDEMAYYDEQFARIDRLNAEHPGTVVLDPHGDDMAQWYQGIGVALSTSDWESFHLTVADGAASGALPALLAWPGSDLIYPRDWISPDVESMVERIAGEQRDARAYVEQAHTAFSHERTTTRLSEIITGGRA